MAINIKAQASSIFDFIKEAPIAKGLINNVHEEGLVSGSRLKVLSNINETATKNIDATKTINNKIVDDKEFSTGKNINDYIDKNLEAVDRIGLGGIPDDIMSHYNKRYNGDEDMIKLHANTIINQAKDKIAQSTNNIMTDEVVSDYILNAAKNVDGKLTMLTPVEMAKKYYLEPANNVVNNVKQGGLLQGLSNSKEDLTKLGVRASVDAVTGVATGAAISTAGNLTASAFARVGGNDYEH